jgi:hypothetical protein
MAVKLSGDRLFMRRPMCVALFIRLLEFSDGVCIIQGDGVTYRTGFADDNRNQFMSKGNLDNTQDSNFRPISTSVDITAPK